MEKLNLLGQNKVKPDTHCYTILLNTYTKNSAATDDISTRSLQILERLSREFRQGVIMELVGSGESEALHKAEP